MGSRLISTFMDVWDGIRTQPGRVGLSFMAIAIGIASLTVLIAILSGLGEKSRQVVKELGVNVVGILQQGGAGQDAKGGLQERHASFLSINLPGSYVSTTRLYNVPTLGTNKLLSIVATDSSLIHIRQWKLHNGRFLDPQDIKNRERNVVVSKSLSKLWNWKVGNIIMLRNTPFKIVGIVEIGGGALDTEMGDSSLVFGERVAFVPKTISPYWVSNLNTPQATTRYLASNLRDPGSTIDAIFIKAPTYENFTNVVSTAQRLLLQPEYHLKGVSWVTPESLIKSIKKLQNTIRLTIGSVAVLSLILGGTTLMSLMVANVWDRVTEIGLRRALGASQRDIALLFVIEGCAVTGVAAIVAILGTHLLLSISSEAFSIPLKLGLESILVPLVVALVLGIVFSYWPAKSAAKITPSEALRNE